LDFKTIQESRPDERLVILVQVSTQDELGNPKAIGYAVINALENTKLNLGTFERPLQPPPITLLETPSDVGSRNQGSIFFSLLRPSEIYDSGEFIANNRPQISQNNFWKESEEDGFDIYVDGLHNLPDNVSVVKVLAKVINNKGVS
jgi:hypothetical protein